MTFNMFSRNKQTNKQTKENEMKKVIQIMKP